MKYTPVLTHHRSLFVARLVAYGVALNGLAIIATPIVSGLLQRHGLHFYSGSGRFIFDAQLVLALALLYLSILLRRGKRTAWFVTLCVYAAMFALNIGHFIDTTVPLVDLRVSFLSDVIMPAFVVISLVLSRRAFTVKSDISSFTFSLRIIALVMAVTFIYGVSGFLLMDRHDFHEEITVPDAIHRTIDQFDLTTNTILTPHTRRAKAFMDSLSILSSASVAYTFVSLFQPLRARFTDQAHHREIAERLLKKYPASSEDFFKLWPHDKLYFFNENQTAGLAYSTHYGVALVVGDPMGDHKAFPALLDDFDIFCQTNDWAVAFVHTDPKFSELYKRQGLALQKIGEEAVVTIKDFLETEAHNKYFRQIYNRFTKQGCSVEIMQPPHSDALLSRLQYISDEWLKRPGRRERRFMMGYFSADYMQHGPVAVLRDDAGTIQAFINQIPSYDDAEANFDMLRPAQAALGNSNDFILLEFLKHLDKQGFTRLNLGLCPLAGLTSNDEANTVTNNALRFLYANGDRFYSFNGLQRFKAKYNPEWQGRYIAYRGGIRGFTRVMNALNRAMRI
ncbi:MAG: bifunctional lysylphosphatidylglycerol flippase/synthetase MprF [Candidatus Saccharibacteria bacterium]